jgi:hypothetical protein
MLASPLGQISVVKHAGLTYKELFSGLAFLKRWKERNSSHGVRKL